MRAMKRYGQRCPAARALDVVGERWTPLVVRELLTGPKRFTDLADGLPGIGTNILTNRLAALQEHGVIEKHTLPRPAPVVVYELTEAGQALAPLLRELRTWGERYGAPPQAGDAVRPAWILQSAASRSPRLRNGQACELRIDGDVFVLAGGPDGVELSGAAPRRPDAVATFDERLLLRLASGRVKPAEAIRDMEIDGDRRVASTVASMIAGAAG
jgi:DNA-binding HxlR family transcriptional regulator